MGNSRACPFWEGSSLELACKSCRALRTCSRLTPPLHVLCASGVTQRPALPVVLAPAVFARRFCSARRLPWPFTPKPDHQAACRALLGLRWGTGSESYWARPKFLCGGGCEASRRVRFAFSRPGAARQDSGGKHFRRPWASTFLRAGRSSTQNRFFWAMLATSGAISTHAGRLGRSHPEAAQLAHGRTRTTADSVAR